MDSVFLCTRWGGKLVFGDLMDVCLSPIGRKGCRSNFLHSRVLAETFFR